jgi:hypothetical protein
MVVQKLEEHMRSASEIPPEVGSWYRRLDRSPPFQVVAYDQDAGTVDIEYFDGTVDEWPTEQWYGFDIRPCDPPQDWSGPFDDIEPDELSPDDRSLAAGESPEALESLLEHAIQQAPDIGEE